MFKNVIMCVVEIVIFNLVLTTGTLSGEMTPTISGDTHDLMASINENMPYLDMQAEPVDYSVVSLLNSRYRSTDDHNYEQLKTYFNFDIDETSTDEYTAGGSSSGDNIDSGYDTSVDYSGKYGKRETTRELFANHRRETNTNFLKRSVNWLFVPAVVVLIGRPIGHQRGFGIYVPMDPVMTVLSGLISAMRRFQNVNSNAIENPFNVSLDWDEFLSCYTVVQAAGVENRSRRKWFITVRTSIQKIVYRDRCLPEGSEVAIRPNSQIVLSFDRT